MKNKKTENKFLPKGYRYLKEGEVIQEGDYFWGNKNNKWNKIKDTADTSNWVKEQVIRKET